MSELNNRDIYPAYTHYEDLPKGGIVRSSGNAETYRTGDWRSQKPVIDFDKCKQCLFCWPICPDMAIPVVEEKRQDFDYDHCKGCGVCAKACPFGAITMVDEN